MEDDTTQTLAGLCPSKPTNNVVKGRHNNELIVLWECHNECESDYAVYFLAINKAMNYHRSDWLYSFQWRHHVGWDQFEISRIVPLPLLWIKHVSTVRMKVEIFKKGGEKREQFCLEKEVNERKRESNLKWISKELSIFLKGGTCSTQLGCCIKLSWKWKLIRYDDWTPGIVISRTAWLLSCN